MSKIKMYYKNLYLDKKKSMNLEIDDVLILRDDIERLESVISKVKLEKDIYKSMFDFRKCETEKGQNFVFDGLSNLLNSIKELEIELKDLKEKESLKRKEIDFAFLELKTIFSKYLSAEEIDDFE